ncbi:MAG: hypothetical protein PHW76_04855 [Alphaproteobacteria bacterium]|nr:hypothetical protein [Alphaproteobacteria bacterium]
MNPLSVAAVAPVHMLVTLKRYQHMHRLGPPQKFSATSCIRAPDAGARRCKRKSAQPIASNLSLYNLHFHYEVSGDSPAWRPLCTVGWIEHEIDVWLAERIQMRGKREERLKRDS